MRKVVLVCAGFPSGNSCAVEGQYLMAYDPDAYDGRGDATFTRDVRSAMKFDSVAQALELWTASPKVRPVREDGKPNRPLTAFSMVTEQVDE